MKKTLALLLATSTLAGALTLPAMSATRPPGEGGLARSFEALLENVTGVTPYLFVSDDDDDDEDDEDDDRDGRRGHDDDHDEHDDDDDDECDDDGDDDCIGGAANPVPAGTVAPPQNGLFGDGTPPRVQVN